MRFLLLAAIPLLASDYTVRIGNGLLARGSDAGVACLTERSGSAVIQ